ncbi:MAG: M20/M25/M40 family metallo-hydrolase, partial [Candidatus Ornithomonoglobus sp.]
MEYAIYIILAVIALFLLTTVIRAAFFKPKAAELKANPLENENVDVKRACDHLSQAISCKTVSRTNPDDVDWSEFEKFHKFLESAYPLIHKNMTKEVVSRASLIYHWKGSDSSLEPMALISHQDVVPVTPGTEADWEHPPFSGYNDGTYIWGRGALDMKNHLICVMEAIETLMEEGFVPERDIYLCFGHDEEVNDSGTAGAIDMANLLKERGVHLDSVLDEGGAFLTLNIKGIIENQAAAAIGIAEKGYSDYRITVHAKGGHSSQPPKHSALGMIANVIKDLENHQFKAKLMPFMMNLFTKIGKRVSYPARLVTCNVKILKPLILAVCKKIPTAACLTRTTTAVTMAKGSPASNVLPQAASITVNFRQMPGTSV